jgi:hypothetical protein
MEIKKRLKFGRYTVYFMLSETQKLTGITSLLRSGLHILLLDIENCSLDECLYELQDIQDHYGLGDIFVSSDYKNSFRCWCFTQMTFRQMIHVMADQALFHLDENFFEWTARHGKATLRLSNKLNREPQKIVAVLTSHTEIVPDELESVIYDTGTGKRMAN